MAVAAFTQDDAQGGGASGAAGLGHHRQRAQPFAIVLHALEHGGDLLAGGKAVDPGAVFFFHEMAGMGKGVGKFAVIGQEDESFTVIVEAADGIESQAPVHPHSFSPFNDRGAAFGIVGGAQDAAGFVGEIGAVRFGLYATAIQGHTLLGRINAGAQFCHRDTVDLYAPGRDQFLAVTARADAGGGKEFLQADRIVGGGGGLRILCSHHRGHLRVTRNRIWLTALRTDSFSA